MKNDYMKEKVNFATGSIFRPLEWEISFEENLESFNCDCKLHFVFYIYDIFIIDNYILYLQGEEKKREGRER